MNEEQKRKALKLINERKYTWGKIYECVFRETSVQTVAGENGLEKVRDRMKELVDLNTCNQVEICSEKNDEKTARKRRKARKERGLEWK